MLYSLKLLKYHYAKLNTDKGSAPMSRWLNHPDIGNFLFRAFIGLSMALAHGLGKIPPPSQLVDGLAGMGFPLPVVFAWLAGGSEFFGGILIAVGLFTRPAALFLGVTGCSFCGSR